MDRQFSNRVRYLIPVTVAKFGGSALGVDGILIGKIIDRIEQLKEKTKVVAVFSAPSSLIRKNPIL